MLKPKWLLVIMLISAYLYCGLDVVPIVIDLKEDNGRKLPIRYHFPETGHSHTVLGNVGDSDDVDISTIDVEAERLSNLLQVDQESVKGLLLELVTSSKEPCASCLSEGENLRAAGVSLDSQPVEYDAEAIFYPQPETSSERWSLLTVVSGYWPVTNKYSESGDDSTLWEPYKTWFRNSLRIAMPYVFYTTESLFATLAEYRADLPTIFVAKELSSFKTVDTYNASWVHPDHVPSKDVAMIWIEKMNLLRITSRFRESEFYVWVDAALPSFRDKAPPKAPWSTDVIRSLPRDRVSYCHVHATSSENMTRHPHSFAGGVLVVPHRLVDLVFHLFYQEYDLMRATVADWRCGSDQVIFSRIRSKHPELFHAMSYEYGDIRFLWTFKE